MTQSGKSVPITTSIRGLVCLVMVVGVAAAGQPQLAASPPSQPAFLCGLASSTPKPLATPFLGGIHIGTTGSNVNKLAAPNVPVQFVNYVKSVNANWIGIPQPMHVNDTLDPKVRRDFQDPYYPSYTNTELRSLIQSFKSRGVRVYLNLALETRRTEDTPRPLMRWLIGDPLLDSVNPIKNPADWPWMPAHPQHAAFVTQFWQTYTEQAVEVARIAEEEGVGLFSVGTETDRLFRTRPDDYNRFPNEFKDELSALVAAVRSEYSGPVTYDMDWPSFQFATFTGPGAQCFWKDLGLDVIGVSGYFPLSTQIPVVPLTETALRNAWANVFSGFLAPVRSENPGVPIVFTEIGRVDSLESPYRHDYNVGASGFVDTDNDGVDDGRLTQLRLFSGLFDTMKQDSSLVVGMFLWNEFIEDDNGYFNFKVATYNRDFSFRNKPAQSLLSNFYRSLTTARRGQITSQ